VPTRPLARPAGACLDVTQPLLTPSPADSPATAPSAQDWLARARQARDAADWEGAVNAAEAAWAASDDASARMAAGHVAAFSLFRLGRLKALIDAGERTLNLPVAAQHPEQRAELLRWITLAACETGDFDLGLRCGVEACELATASGDPGQRAVALNAVGACFERMGDPWQAERLMREALDQARLQAAPYPRLISLNNLSAVTIGAFHLMRGGVDPQEATAALQRSADYAREALALAQAGGDPFFLVFVEGNLGEALLHLGQLDAAEALLHSALARAEAHDHAAQIWRIRCSLAEGLIERGRHAQAREGLLELWARDAATVPQATLIRLHQALYRAHRSLGQVAEALDHHERAEILQRQRAARQLRAQSRLLVTRVEAEQNRLQAERARLEVLTERARAAELALHASQDALTGLGNRRYLDQHLPALLQQAQERQQDLALAIVDLDHFKQVNDQHGHRVGDQVLVQLAQMLRESTRSGDLIARIGGEEFLLALPQTDLARATEVCERLRDSVQAHAWQTLAGGLTVTISIGLSQAPPYDASDLFDHADRALYRAKQAGRNRVRAG
jgi:diguanylate cyclase (GGDEF)-like protein